jgi:selenocysteine-specific elongation factor
LMTTPHLRPRHEAPSMPDGPRNLVLGTAGHIDHGKTALVRALTGIDTDRLPAEKQRGITIDLGFASLALGEIQLALIDVPGHERFIRNMLAGASGLDLAMLVVAADDSVMPQTREHMQILSLLGLSSGVVALTKCDLSDPSWLDLVEEEIRALVHGTFLEGAAIVRTSSVTGLGLPELKKALAAACTSAGPAFDTGLFRMAIDRSFTLAGHGTVVTGTVASGSVAVGDELEWQPQGRTVRVRGLHRHDQSVDQIGRGSRAAVNLVGVHHSEIVRGHELAAPGYLEASRVLTVDLAASEGAFRPLKHRERFKLHIGTAEVSAVLSLLERSDQPAGQSRLAQLLLAEPIAAAHGQPFVLRIESPPATIGGGRVIGPSIRRLRRTDPTAIARLDRLRSSEPGARLRGVLSFSGQAASDRRLVALTGLRAEELERSLASLAASGALIELPLGPRRSIRMLDDSVAELEDRVLRALARLHEAHPRQATIPRARLMTALPELENKTLVTSLLDRLCARGKLIGDVRTVSLPGHEPKLSQGERKLKDELAAAIKAGGSSPPEVTELAAKAGNRATIVPELLALLCEEQRAVLISSSLYLDADVESDLRRRVRERLSAGGTLTMSELRELLGTSRKYSVPIGEYLDRIGLTRREGDIRRLNVTEPPDATIEKP